jgi:hypothetical protein
MELGDLRCNLTPFLQKRLAFFNRERAAMRRRSETARSAEERHRPAIPRPVCGKTSGAFGVQTVTPEPNAPPSEPSRTAASSSRIQMFCHAAFKRRLRADQAQAFFRRVQKQLERPRREPPP